MTTKLNVYEIVTNQIIKALEEGIIPWRMPWKNQMPSNFISKKPYRGMNIWLLSIKNRTTPYWLTFNQCRERGGKIKKGEKATLVVFWKQLRRKEVNKEGKEEIKKVFFLRYYNVFNLDQTEGIEIPKETVIEFKPIEKCEEVVAGYKTAPTIKHAEPRAFYRPKEDFINMPKKETFDSEEDYYSTLFHELTHSTGHESRLKREGVTTLSGFGSEDYSKEELIAEMGSAFLGAETGINNVKVRNNEVAYIQGWLKELRNDKKLVVLSAGKAQRAVDFILNRNYK